MTNVKNSLLIFFSLAILFVGCDSFKEDTLPATEDLMDAQREVTALPGTSVFLDLKKSIKASETIKFQISQAPERGEAVLEEAAILHYKPHSDFTAGQDFLTLDMLNADNQVVDSDIFSIVMVSNVDSLPCNNGALSDYVSVGQGESVIIEPLANDGYCGGATSGAIIEFQGEFAHGQLEQTGLFVYQYTPDPNFTGKDSLRYELELIDSEGNSSPSLAQINVEVFQDLPTDCDSMFAPRYYVLEAPLEPFYLFETIDANPACGIYDWVITEVVAESGQVEITENGEIKYYPGELIIEDITYYVDVNGKTYSQNIRVEIVEGQCVDAIDDTYFLTISDTLGRSPNPYILDVMANDNICSSDPSDYALRLLDNPNMEFAVVYVRDLAVELVADSVFTGNKQMEFLYELCDASVCDTAMVQLELSVVD